MSATRLLVLGVVRLLQPVHGYDVRRMLLSWHADEWGNVNPGSIYHALKAATQDGQLRVVSPPRRNSRPGKTAYELTEWGETDLFMLLRQSLAQVTGSPLPLRAGLCFFTWLDRDELVSTFRNRAAQLTAAADSTRFVIEGGVKPRHVVEHFHLDRWQAFAEAQWALEFVERLERGDYHTPDGKSRPIST
jgi:DNA-binding PadR family transcriptional regulator